MTVARAGGAGSIGEKNCCGEKSCEVKPGDSNEEATRTRHRHDLKQSIRFYSVLFAAHPAVEKDDYAKSDKYWTLDPQGIAWESFHTLESVPVYGDDTRAQAAYPKAKAACCAPVIG